MAKNLNNVVNEELSDRTLELILFKEMMANKDFLGRMCQVVDYRWFNTPHIKHMAKIVVGWYGKYGTIVSRDMMESALTRFNEHQQIDANKIDLNSAMFDFNKAVDMDLGGMTNAEKMSKIQTYIKRESLRNALLDSANDLEKKHTDDITGECLKKFEDIQKMMFDEIDFGTDVGSDTVDDAMEEHIQYLTNPAARISTGWNSLDEATHGGFLKDGRSIYVFMGQAGIGKSNILSNLAYNILRQNLKVMVISMEMSQNVYMRRFESLITKIDIDSLGLGVFVPTLLEKMTKFFKEEHPEARLLVKEFPPKSLNCRQIDQYIEKMVEQKGYKPDVIVIDYLNLIKPNATGRESNMFEDGKAVSEEIRALSYKWEIPIITAVQCNSSGYNTPDIGMENISESRGIAHTADLIVGMYRTEDEMADGIFHMKILKTRFGDVGNLRFHFDKNTMEFTDINDSIDASAQQTSDASQMIDVKSIPPSMSDIDEDIFGKNGGFVDDFTGMP